MIEQQPGSSSPEEQENEDVRLPFSQASMDEQISRYKVIHEMVRKTEVGEEREEGESTFRSFCENAYKYADKLPIEGQTPEQSQNTWATVQEAARLTKEVLETFRQIKMRETAQPNNSVDEIAMMRESPMGHGYGLRTNDEKLNVPKLVGAMRWAMEAHRRGGATVGRKTDATEEQITGIGDDLEYMVKKVNDYL